MRRALILRYQAAKGGGEGQVAKAGEADAAGDAAKVEKASRTRRVSGRSLTTVNLRETVIRKLDHRVVRRAATLEERTVALCSRGLIM